MATVPSHYNPPGALFPPFSNVMRSRSRDSRSFLVLRFHTWDQEAAPEPPRPSKRQSLSLGLCVQYTARLPSSLPNDHLDSFLPPDSCPFPVSWSASTFVFSSNMGSVEPKCACHGYTATFPNQSIHQLIQPNPGAPSWLCWAVGEDNPFPIPCGWPVLALTLGTWRTLDVPTALSST